MSSERQGQVLSLPVGLILQLIAHEADHDTCSLDCCRYRGDKQLVSHNIHSATYNYKYTFSVEIVPICKVRT